jgi:hypothetical protein
MYLVRDCTIIYLVIQASKQSITPVSLVRLEVRLDRMYPRHPHLDTRPARMPWPNLLVNTLGQVHTPHTWNLGVLLWCLGRPVWRDQATCMAWPRAWLAEVDTWVARVEWIHLASLHYRDRHQSNLDRPLDGQGTRLAFLASARIWCKDAC